MDISFRPDCLLTLGWDGHPLRSAIEEKVRRLGIADNVIFSGVVTDTAVYLRDVFDVFVFPSLWEGLPLAVVEAQAAGVPCVLSDRISQEVDLLRPLINRVSLSSSPEDWASVVHQAANMRSEDLAIESLKTVESSPFSIRTSVKHLEEIYAAN